MSETITSVGAQQFRDLAARHYLDDETRRALLCAARLAEAAKSALEALDYLQPGGEPIRETIEIEQLRDIAKRTGNLRAALTAAAVEP